jgi:hypothetical protein
MNLVVLSQWRPLKQYVWDIFFLMIFVKLTFSSRTDFWKGSILEMYIGNKIERTFSLCK